MCSTQIYVQCYISCIDDSPISLADYARDIIESNRYTKVYSKEEAWPPNSFNVLVNVAMITYKNRPEKHYIEIAKQGTLAVDKIVSDCCQGSPSKKPRQDKFRLIKGINKIFELEDKGTSTITHNQPKCILIEGAPGIGKTVLARQIASCWANREVLPEIDLLFVLFLRDPELQKIKSHRDFIHYISMGYFSSEKLAHFTKELDNTKKLCFVLDGYDEYHAPKDRAFITDLINHGVFPNSLLVITSRPISTLKLRNDIENLKKIEILGLAKEERDEYISKACDSEEEIKELGKYLKQQPIINGLCYIPLYLAILLYLFKQSYLPKSLTEMNKFFIMHTVYRHLAKYGISIPDVVVEMTDLPIFKDYLVEMSDLAFRGLQNDQLVFKKAELKFDIVSEQETKNGFGLLQAVQHYPKVGIGKEISFNFLHFTMQEFLAACHVTTLPSEKQSLIMKQTFWEDRYSYMWMMYVGLVGVENNHFTEFISNGKYKNSKKGLKITNVVKRDKRKQLHVFQCYMEARISMEELPIAIASMFKDGKINFNKTTLLSYHTSTLASFMSAPSVSVQWKTLELKNCKLDDAAMNILELFVVDNQEKLESFEIVDLSENLSSPWRVYCTIIKYCKTGKLTLYADTEYEIKDYIIELKDSLESNGGLSVITLYGIVSAELPLIKGVLSGTTTLNALNLPVHQTANEILIQSSYNNININIYGKFNNCTFESINVSDQNIDDRCMSFIAFGLQNNRDLKSLNISQNSITDIGLMTVGNSLKDNSTLLELDISNNPFTNQGIRDFVNACQKLNLQKLNVSQVSMSEDGAIVIGDFVNSIQTLQHFTMSKLKEFSSDGARIFVNKCQNNKTLLVLNISEINLTDDGVDAICSCIEHNIIQELYLSKNKIAKKGAKILAKAVKKNTSLNTFDISENWINNKGVVYFFEKIIKNKDSKLRKLLVAGNMITSSCTRQLEAHFQAIDLPLREALTVYSSESDLILDAKGLMIKKTSCVISMSSSYKNEENRKLVKEMLNIEYRINFVYNCLVRDDKLTVVSLSKMGITREYAKKIAKVISCNKVVKGLDISHNLLGDDGMCIICESLRDNETLQSLNISNNQITSNGAKGIAGDFKGKCKLKNLDISDNNITDDGIIAIINSDSILQEFNASNNDIGEDIEELSRAIQANTNLKTLKLFLKKKSPPFFHDRVLKALDYNNVLTSLKLPLLSLGDVKNEVLRNKVKEINDKRKNNGFEILNCTF